MKKYVITIIHLMISLSFFAFSQENINFKKLDLTEHYKVIDKIIYKPDLIIKILLENKLLTDTSYYDTFKIDYFKSIIPFIKKYFDKEYKIISDEIDIRSEFFDSLVGNNISENNHYSTAHIVKIQNINNNYVRYFYFTYNDLENWKLFNIKAQSPYDHNIHMGIEAIHENERSKIDTNNPEHCKLYNEDSYEAIKKLLNNPDSLYNLYTKIFPPKKLEEKMEAVKKFAENVKNGSQDLIVKMDMIFLPLKDFPDKTITLLNRIELVSPSIPKNIFGFYFMKKNGVWQFFDGKFDVFLRYKYDFLE